MKPPSVDLASHLGDVALTFWRGRRVEVWRLYETLTQLGWKVDTEQSSLMVAMSRTWRAEGIKVWLRLEKPVCAPPDEVGTLDAIRFYRFDPAQMPTTTMLETMYRPGDEEKDWYPSHREEWDWLVAHGDPQTDTFALLRPIPLGEVPEPIREEAWMEIEEGLELEDE